MTSQQDDLVHGALDAFRIELPSWGFANTGTRFGKFLQPAAATTIDEKFSDAGQVHALSGVCPTIALHVSWDLPADVGGALGAAPHIPGDGARDGRADTGERVHLAGVAELLVDRRRGGRLEELAEAG